jgi:hypothetical protein
MDAHDTGAAHRSFERAPHGFHFGEFGHGLMIFQVYGSEKTGETGRSHREPGETESKQKIPVSPGSPCDQLFVPSVSAVRLS